MSMWFWIRKIFNDMFTFNRRLWVHLIIGAVVGKACFLFGADLVMAIAIASVIAVSIECVQAVVWDAEIIDSIGDVIGTVTMAALTAWKG